MIKGEIQSKLKVKSNISVAPKDPSYTNQVVSRSFKQLVFIRQGKQRFEAFLGKFWRLQEWFYRLLRQPRTMRIGCAQSQATLEVYDYTFIISRTLLKLAQILICTSQSLPITVTFFFIQSEVFDALLIWSQYLKGFENIVKLFH